MPFRERKPIIWAFSVSRLRQVVESAASRFAGSAEVRVFDRSFEDALQVVRTLTGAGERVDALMAAGEEEIGAVRGVGPTIAEAVAAFFKATRNLQLIARLKKAGLRMVEPVVASGEGPLAGGVFVLTGTLPSLSRTEATKRIEAAGGAVTGSVSKKTTAVVAGGLGFGSRLPIPSWPLSFSPQQ